MSNMPDELKKLLEELRKWEYKLSKHDNWFNFIFDIEDYDDCEFRLKKEKPLTLEEVRKLKTVYTPFVAKYAEPDCFTLGKEFSSHGIDVVAEKGLAYRTSKGATAHAQMWLDMKVEE